MIQRGRFFPFHIALFLGLCTFCDCVFAVPASPVLQELKSRIGKCAATLPPEKQTGPGQLADAKLAVRKAEVRLGGTATQSPFGSIHTEAFLDNARRKVEALEAGAQPELLGGTGFQERAYISATDGSAEPYLLYVPKNYSDTREWPLVIFLHGYAQDLSVLNWVEYMYSPTLEQVCEAEGAILLMPYGRSNTEFMGIGESDVLQTLEYVRKEFRIDPRRILLPGASMGGSGAYTIASHHPHLFAGVVAITGRVDYYLWMKVLKESLPRFKQIQIDTDYARELLLNLAHVPVLVFHGEHDTLLAPAQSALMQHLMAGLGQRCEYIRLDGMGHQGTWAMSFSHDRFAEMIRTARSPERPTKVTLRTFTLKYPRAYWVEIRGITTWGQPAEVSAEVMAGGDITVTASNVSALRLGPGMPAGAGERTGTISLTLNGHKLPPATVIDNMVDLRLAADDEPPDPQETRKTPELCGPVREAYDGPFLIVYPEDASAETAGDRMNAGYIARSWQLCAQAMPRLRSDASLTQNDIRNFNLILCGSPDTLKFLAEVADRLPIRFTPESYMVAGRAFPREGNGMQFICPNPLNPKRYVVVVHGALWAPKVQVNHRLDFLPDFIVYTAETTDDGTWFPTNRFLCAGYFNQNWRVSAGSTWYNELDGKTP